MAVVRINFGEAVLGSAGEVECVGSAEEVGVSCGPEELFKSLLNRIGQRKPVVEAVLGICDVLFEYGLISSLL